MQRCEWAGCHAARIEDVETAGGAFGIKHMADDYAAAWIGRVTDENWFAPQVLTVWTRPDVELMRFRPRCMYEPVKELAARFARC